MRKLKLDVEELEVESFDTEKSEKDKKGTVFGAQQCTCWTQCNQNTCQWSCNGSCWYTECLSDPTCNPTWTDNGIFCHCCPY